MYESFYGLTGKPFQLNPDPAFYFGSRQHKRAMSYLEYGLHQNEGFIVITGEIGAGKTTLVRNLFNQLDADQVVAAHLVSTQLDADDTLRLVAAAFGIPTKKTDKSELLLLLEAYLVSIAQQGKRCLLVVDEAQNLTSRAVEELRMLSNFQLETHALLQSFLIGQPEFRATLQGPEMEQLRQRVIAACHIGPLTEEETRGYIEHRLARVSWHGTPEFEPDAYRSIYYASGGIPRRINSLCDRLLWYGYLAEKKVFSAGDVGEVAAEMNDETPSSSNAKQTRSAAGSSGEATFPVPSGIGVPGQQGAGLPAVSLQQVPVVSEGAIAVQMQRLELSLSRLEASMVRMERNNLATATMLRRLLDSNQAGNVGEN